MQHLVKQNSKCPNIHPIVVLSFEKHLRGHILISPAKSASFGLDILGTPPEITNFDVEDVV